MFSSAKLHPSFVKEKCNIIANSDFRQLWKGLFTADESSSLRAIQGEACGLFKVTRTLFLERHVATEFFKWNFFQSFEQHKNTTNSIVQGGLQNFAKLSAKLYNCKSEQKKNKLFVVFQVLFTSQTINILNGLHHFASLVHDERYEQD